MPFGCASNGKTSPNEPMPIAIVGMSCRFPDDATNPEKFWDMLIQKRSARQSTPPDRFNVDAFYHPDYNRGGTMNHRGGHYLKQDVKAFDAPFFSISPAEAVAMDPQQRLLLEVVYEATESAGMPLEKLAGTDTSCFVGSLNVDYKDMQERDKECAPKYEAVGTGCSMLSNRMSWFFDFKGPSVTLDTACSTSLVGVHLACQSLQTGESRMAVVAASSLLLDPAVDISGTKMHFLSLDSACFAFDARANGYVRGEGVAALILKPLDEAIKDNDAIHAVIRGTGVNHDGKTASITQPSGTAQAALIRNTYEQGNCDLSATGYFEAHGTGTPVGDLTEASAIGEVFAAHRQSKLYTGSVKTNIGHLEGASGIAGVIKAVLCVAKGVIAPNVSFDTPNPAIDFDAWKICVPTEPIPWPVPGLRRASVNSFGYGGTNAHVIIDDADSYLPRRASLQTRVPAEANPRVFVLSAKDEKSLKALSRAYSDHVKTRPVEDEEVFLDRLSYTLCERRSRLKVGMAVIAASREELVSKLEEPPTPCRLEGCPKVAFVFTGQGAQWWAMGRELVVHPVFGATLAACERALKQLGVSWSLKEELTKSQKVSRMDEVAISQPLLTAVQMALVDLYASWGIRPLCVVGHSSGEIAAAYTIGAVSLETAMALAHYRGILVTTTAKQRSGPSGMLAVGLSEHEAELEIQDLGDEFGKVGIGCINSPKSVTLSGDLPAILQLQKRLVPRGVFCRKLPVELGFHSHHMRPIADDYARCLANMELVPPHLQNGLPMYSSVTGKKVLPNDMGPEYWAQGVLQCVRFSDALKELCQSNPIDVLLEIGPHSGLAGPIQQILQGLPSNQSDYQSALVRGKDARRTALQVAGNLLVRGYPVKNLLGDTRLSPLTDLPAYCWNHDTTYWSESRLSRGYRFRPFGRHDIVGAPVADWNPLQPRWRNFLRISEQPWLKSHVVQGAMVYPAAGFCCMAVEAMRQLAVIYKTNQHAPFTYIVRQVNIMNALIIPETDEGIEIEVSMRPERTSGGNSNEFRIVSYLEGGWKEHCRGIVSLADSGNQIWHHDQFQDLDTATLKSVDSGKFYQTLQATGIYYGPEFRGIHAISAAENVAVVEMTVPDTRRTMPHQFESDCLIHPAALDCIFQTGIAGATKGDVANLKDPFVPVFIQQLSISGDLIASTGYKYKSVAKTHHVGFWEAKVNILTSEMDSYTPIVQINGLVVKALGAGSSTFTHHEKPLSMVRQLCATAVWEPDVDLLSEQDMVRPFRDMAPLMHRYITLLAHKNPSLSWLEIGASQGSLTVAVLEALTGRNDYSKFASYTWTDRLDDSVKQAADKFGGDSKTQMRFKKLNIEGDLHDQGFEDGNFDVILVGNALLTSCDIDHTVSNVRKMLRPGGKLIMPKLNSYGPKWEKAFKNHGLARQLDLPDCLDASEEHARLIVARVVASTTRKTTSTIIIVLASEKMSQRTVAIASALEAMLQNGNNNVQVLQLSNLKETSLTGAVCISLVELDKPWLSTLASPCEFEILKQLTQETAALFYMTRGGSTLAASACPRRAAILGLARCLRAERANWPCITIDFDAHHQASIAKTAELIHKVYKTTFENGQQGIDHDLVENNGVLHIERAVEDCGMNRRIAARTQGVALADRPQDIFQSAVPLKMHLQTPESLDSFVWKEDLSLQMPVLEDQIVIQVRAIGLILRDLDIATGNVRDDYLGHECAGIVTQVGGQVAHFQPGDRVVALCLGSMATHIRVPCGFAAKMPDNIDFATAAALPMAIVTADLCLNQVARVQQDESVLIHQAGDSTGQAAVILAKAIGADVFVTVSSEAQKQLLTIGYGIDESHIFSSTDLEFVRKIQSTLGHGVDVILNSLSGQALEASWSCLAPFGRFVDMSKPDAHGNGRLDMAPFPKNATFSSFDLADMVRHRPRLVQQAFQKVIKASTWTRPIALNVLPISKTGQAFAALKTDKAKIVLEIVKGDHVQIAAKVEEPINFSDQASYLLAGGFGGLGRSISRWMVRHGAKNLIFVSRNAGASAQAKQLLDDLNAEGVGCAVLACDISDSTALSQSLQTTLAHMPPIRGVIQAAMVLNDQTFANMSYEAFFDTIRPKIDGSWNLHLATLTQPLDFFVMLSSLSGFLGNPGQANYAAGCTYQTALAAHRRSLGLAATAIDLGRVAEVGHVAEQDAGGYLDKHLRTKTLLELKEDEFLAMVELAMLPKDKGGVPNGHLICDPHMIVEEQETSTSLPVLSHLVHRSKLSSTCTATAANTRRQSLAMLLGSSKDPEQRCTLVLDGLCRKMARLLMMTVQEIDSTLPVKAYPVDSLVLVELRNWFAREAGIEVAVFDIVQAANLRALAKKAVSKMG